MADVDHQHQDRITAEEREGRTLRMSFSSRRSNENPRLLQAYAFPDRSDEGPSNHEIDGQDRPSARTNDRGTRWHR